MPGGAYSALSGMQARLEELDRLAPGLLNVSTAGYKTERTGTFMVERDQFATALDSAVDVVSGVSRTDFRAGNIATPGRDLDVAIEGHGFFVVDTPAGERYRRHRAFTRRAPGGLPTPAGEPVLGDGGEITRNPGPPTVDPTVDVHSGNAR